MIFVTLGTDHHPFDRLVAWIIDAINEGIITEKVIIQHGFTCVTDNRIEKHQMIGFDRMMNYFDDASLVITHASSTAMLVCHHGKTPIVVPRDPVHGEHIDNHQQDFIDSTRDVYPFFVAKNKEEFFDGIRNKEKISKWEDQFEIGGTKAIAAFGIEIRSLMNS